MKNKDIEFLLNIAKLASEQSYAIRLKVGGVMSDKDGNIIAYGYNGTVKGMSNECEYRVYSSFEEDVTYYDENINKHYKLVTKDSTIHAEQNIIAHAARRGISIDGGTIFLTHSPCNHCTALLIQSGVKEAIFLEKFRTYSEVESEFGKYIKLTHWLS